MSLSIAFEGLSPALLFRILRYGLVGFWGGGGAPGVFVQIGLAGTSLQDVVGLLHKDSDVA